MKHDICANNPNNSHTEKVARHKPCGYDLNIVKSYDENISTYYRGKDYLSHVCKNLRDHATKLATIKKNPLITDDKQLNHERSKNVTSVRQDLILMKIVSTTIITEKL